MIMRALTWLWLGAGSVQCLLSFHFSDIVWDRSISDKWIERLNCRKFINNRVLNVVDVRCYCKMFRDKPPLRIWEHFSSERIAAENELSAAATKTFLCCGLGILNDENLIIFSLLRSADLCQSESYQRRRHNKTIKANDNIFECFRRRVLSPEQESK